ncbi:MAG: adenylate/guanylate cyclase domain-containing protein [Pseudomonadota bacterium]
MCGQACWPLRQYNDPVINVGIGLHTGSLVMGIIGDENHMETTTISDAVNTAARMEGSTKYYGAKLLLTGDTLTGVDNSENYHFRYLGGVQVKGKQHAVKVYECLDAEAPEKMSQKLDSMTRFNSGMDCFYEKDLTAARQAFESVVAQNAEDIAARRMLDRIGHFEQTGIPEDWIGVETMSEK